MAMNLYNFRVNVVIRVALILLLCMMLAWVLITTQWFFTPLVLGILLLSVVINLVYYTERTTKKLTQFLISIRQGAFTNTFTGQRNDPLEAGLSSAFNDVIHEFQKISIEKETQYLYLQTLNENIGVSIISYEEDGRVEFMNPAAKVLLKKPYLRTIHEMENIDAKLLQVITSLPSGEKRVVKTFIQDEMQQLSVQVKDFVLHQKNFRLVLLQNINSELDQKEIEAWQKLISVLTHEIMNSVTPIASLSNAINGMLSAQDSFNDLTGEDKEDVISSLKTIENRSKGLVRFVDAYKHFSRVPELKLTSVDLHLLIQRIADLLRPDIKKSGLELTLSLVKGPLTILADRDLIEQVLINIVKNAIEAMKSQADGAICITTGRNSGGRKVITITDNGPGISDDILERIFIPFYTTKKQGTGIGLSFARQIMKLHNGDVTVKKPADRGTVFMLIF